jgi:hypothetical protein
MPIVSPSPIKRDDVEREAHQLHHDEGREQRRGDRDHDDGGVAPGVQEEQHDDRGQQDALAQALQHAVDRGFRVIGGGVDLSETDVGIELDQILEFGARRIGRANRIGVDLAFDAQQDRRGAVVARGQALFDVTVFNRREVADLQTRLGEVGLRAVEDLERNLQDVLRLLDIGVDRDRGFGGRRVDPAAGQVRVVVSERVVDVQQGGIGAEQPALIGEDVNLTGRVTGRLHVEHARHRFDLRDEFAGD